MKTYILIGIVMAALMLTVIVSASKVDEFGTIKATDVVGFVKLEDLEHYLNDSKPDVDFVKSAEAFGLAYNFDKGTLVLINDRLLTGKKYANGTLEMVVQVTPSGKQDAYWIPRTSVTIS